MLKSLKPAQLLALLGAVSGALTTLVRWELFVVSDTSILPGIFFGAVLAYGIWRWQTKDWLKLLGVMLGVIIAWVAAWNSAVHLHDYFDTTLGFGKPQTFAVLGLIAGFVGAALTAATIYLLAPAFRVRKNWLRVVLFGTAAGILLALPEAGFGSGTFALMPLFVAWQAGVAYLVAGGITGLK